MKLKEIKSGETAGKVQHRVLQRIREAKSKSLCIRTDVDEIVVSKFGIKRVCF